MASFLPERRKIDASIDMTPLIDVVFQLLIFLMVSSKFIKPDVQVDLPSGKGEAVQVDTKVDRHVLSISPENTITLNGAEISLENFENALAAAITEAGVKRLEIRGDTTSELGTFIDLIEKAKLAGIESLSYHKKAPVESE